jgi:hypothetical protein
VVAVLEEWQLAFPILVARPLAQSHCKTLLTPAQLGCTRNANDTVFVSDGREVLRFELYCQQNNIITLCMPSHSSHLLQPLDVGCFGPLKKAYGRQVETKRTMIPQFTTDWLPAQTN